MTRNPWSAETAMCEMSVVSLVDALDYLALLVRRHGRPETERTIGSVQAAEQYFGAGSTGSSPMG
jgi:hypothetical protein